MDKVQALKDSLTYWQANTDSEIFELHCASLLEVINSKTMLSENDKKLLEQLYDSYFDDSVLNKNQDYNTYLKRQRSIIVSWTSPSDGEVSYTWVRLPENFNKENEYPLYVHLHGLWPVADEKIHYLVWPGLGQGESEIGDAFNDGFLIEPWGRGNLWYRGISETDIWECIDRIYELYNIDNNRRYISGFSMGGSGAWYLASQSPDYWTAVGIYAGVITYEGGFQSDMIKNLSKVPASIISGDEDDLTQWCIMGADLLRAAGNNRVDFKLFEGGHEYREENIAWLYNSMISKEPEDYKVGEIDSMLLFPNPASNNLYIGGYGELSYAAYEIYNIKGTLLQRGHWRDRSIDIATLHTGIFILKLTTVSGPVNLKFVKK